jgi:hypothetical protein
MAARSLGAPTQRVLLEVGSESNLILPSSSCDNRRNPLRILNQSSPTFIHPLSSASDRTSRRIQPCFPSDGIHAVTNREVQALLHRIKMVGYQCAASILMDSSRSPDYNWPSQLPTAPPRRIRNER